MSQHSLDDILFESPHHRRLPGQKCAYEASRLFANLEPLTP